MEADVVAPEGRLDSTTSPAFLEAVNAVTSTGRTRLLIDLSAVSYISSAGLRVILVAAKTLAARGGRLALHSLSAEIHQVIETVGFASLANLSVHPDPEAARRALA